MSKKFHAPFNYPGYIASNSLNSPRFISYLVENTYLHPDDNNYIDKIYSLSGIGYYSSSNAKVRNGGVNPAIFQLLDNQDFGDNFYFLYGATNIEFDFTLDSSETLTTTIYASDYGPSTLKIILAWGAGNASSLTWDEPGESTQTQTFSIGTYTVYNSRIRFLLAANYDSFYLFKYPDYTNWVASILTVSYTPGGWAFYGDEFVSFFSTGNNSSVDNWVMNRDLGGEG